MELENLNKLTLTNMNQLDLTKNNSNGVEMNYVDSMTPEEREEQEKLQESVVTTTASAVETPIRTVEELFDEYSSIREDYGIEIPTVIKNKLRQIIQEIKSQVRREVVEEIRDLEKQWYKTDKKTGEKSYIGGSQCRSCMLYRDSVRPQEIIDILSKGITLKN